MLLRDEINRAYDMVREAERFSRRIDKAMSCVSPKAYGIALQNRRRGKKKGKKR